MISRWLKFGLILGALSGCSFIPGAGPYRGDVKGDASIYQKPDKAERALHRYVLLDMSRGVMDAIDTAGTSSSDDYSDWPGYVDPDDIRVGVGDSLNITIYESKTGGLFIPREAGVRPGNFINLPAQIVDQSGKITVPYAGQIHVLQKSLSQIELEIVDALKSKAIDPQVIVTYGDRGGSEVSVIGDVNNARRYPLNFNGERILDAIARAGGPKSPGYETYVALQRGGAESTISLDTLVGDPTRNIYLKPNDTVYLYREPSMYMVFGAAGNNGRFEFQKRKILLSEAMGKADGLQFNQANPEVVFLYRHTEKTILEKLVTLTEGSWDSLGKKIPTIYRFNLRDPNGLFFTQNFAVQNNDIIFIPDADSVNLQKFVQILNPGTATAINVRNVD